MNVLKRLRNGELDGISDGFVKTFNLKLNKSKRAVVITTHRW